MIIWPAIDICENVCVRLTQGDYSRKTVYSVNPLDVALQFEQEGASHLHVVDLSRAKDAKIEPSEWIQLICRQTQLKVEVGGGIRSVEDCQRLMDMGVERVILGSLAVRTPSVAHEIFLKFPKTVLAADVRIENQGSYRVATEAWSQSQGGPLLVEFLKEYKEVQTVLCTDIERDGCLSGPNFELYRELKKTHPSLEVLASGGVGGFEDLRSLAVLGVEGVIVGKAFYEGRMKVAEALDVGKENYSMP